MLVYYLYNHDFNCYKELSNLFLSVAAKEITYNQFKQYVMQKSLENKMQR